MNVAVVIATAVNNEGRRESLGFDVITTEDRVGWTTFLRSLVARGLSGVSLVVSDDHKGLKAASYMGSESLAKARLRPIDCEAPDEPVLEAAGAA